VQKFRKSRGVLPKIPHSGMVLNYFVRASFFEDRKQRGESLPPRDNKPVSAGFPRARARQRGLPPRANGAGVRVRAAGARARHQCECADRKFASSVRARGRGPPPAAAAAMAGHGGLDDDYFEANDDMEDNEDDEGGEGSGNQVRACLPRVWPAAASCAAASCAAPCSVRGPLMAMGVHVTEAAAVKDPDCIPLGLSPQHAPRVQVQERRR
jgi:hypothetical protein